MVEREVLFQVLDALEALEIPYMVVGSFASTYWGRPRTTHDADLLIEMPPSKAAALARALEPDFYAPDFYVEEAVQGRDHFNVIHLRYPFKVDLWFCQDTPYDRERFARRKLGTMFGRRVWVTSAEDIILGKLLWFQAAPVLHRQLQDALEVYEIQEPALDQGYLDGWAEALGVAGLLAQIRQQAARPPGEDRAGR